MRLLLFNLCALVACGLANFCTYPPEMTGLAAESVGIITYRFSISIPEQKAMFKAGWDFTEPIKNSTYIFLDYEQHQKYEFYKGKCIQSPIDESLEILPGPPDDAEILTQQPSPDALPRTVAFRSKYFKEIYVAVDMMNATTCYPLGMPYIKLTPKKRIADHYNVRNETIEDPLDMNPDLSTCVQGKGWVV